MISASISSVGPLRAATAAKAVSARAPATSRAVSAWRPAVSTQPLALKRTGFSPRVNPSLQASHAGSLATGALPAGFEGPALVEPTQEMLMSAIQPVLGDLSEGLETPVQLLYLLTLLVVLVAGAFLVVRQVLVRNELEETIKVLGERKRRGEATAEDFFELGVILVRKKLYTQATQNLRKAQELWDGEPEELAQVHNAIGFSAFNMGRYETAVEEYQQAVALQPGYVTAWNNLGDAYEGMKKYREAMDCYTEVLSYAPDNNVARSRKEILGSKLQRLGGGRR